MTIIPNAPRHAPRHAADKSVPVASQAGWPYPPLAKLQKPVSMSLDARSDAFLPGVFHFQSRAHSYKLYVPPCAGGRPSLVVMLHGCGQTAADFAVGTGMNDLARSNNVAVLYPEQSHAANSHGCWNWYDEEHQVRGHGEPAWIAALARMVANKLTVDATRIFVAGLSAGGTMAATVARAYPELFAACAVHSGLPAGAAKGVIHALWTMRCGAYDKVVASARHVPTIVFHGEVDSTVHPSHGRRVIEAALGGAGRRSRSCQVVSRFDEGVLTEGVNYVQRSYSSPLGALQAEHWQVPKLGHAWSGGDLAGTYTEREGPNASKEFLRFFNSVALQ